MLPLNNPNEARLRGMRIAARSGLSAAGGLAPPSVQKPLAVAPAPVAQPFGPEATGKLPLTPSAQVPAQPIDPRDSAADPHTLYDPGVPVIGGDGGANINPGAASGGASVGMGSPTSAVPSLQAAMPGATLEGMPPANRDQEAGPAQLAGVLQAEAAPSRMADSLQAEAAPGRMAGALQNQMVTPRARGLPRPADFGSMSGAGYAAGGRVMKSGGAKRGRGLGKSRGGANVARVPVKGFADGGRNYLPASLINQIHDNPGQDWSQYRGSLGNVWDQSAENLDPRIWDLATRTLRPEIAEKFMRDGVQYEPVNWTHGVLDQGKVIMDPELGPITHKGNNRAPPSGGFSDVLPWAMAALPAAAIAGGVGGAAGVSEGVATGAAGMTPEALLPTTSLGALDATPLVELGTGAGTGGATAAGALAPEALLPETTLGGLDSTSLVELAQNPAVQQAAASSGTSVTQWLSNPQNLLSAGRLVAGLAAGASGSSGAGTVAPITANSPTTVTANNPPAPATSNPTADLFGTPSGASSSNPITVLAQASSAGGGSSGGPSFVSDLLAEAAKSGSDSEQEAMASKAAADAAQREAITKRSRRSRLISQGFNPDDPRGVAGEMDRLAALDNAKLKIGAENIARANEKAKGFSQRAAAAGLGLQQYGIATNRDIANAQMATQASLANASLSAREREAALARDTAAAERAWRTGESTAGRDWQTGQNAADRDLRAQQINAGIQQGNNANNIARSRGIGAGIGAAADVASRVPWGSVFGSSSGSNWAAPYAGDSGWGDWMLAGGGRISLAKYREKVRARGINFAEGGDVSGPGTSTSDSIPAQLSDGEFVVNAEGTKLLDKIAPGFLEAANERGMRARKVREQGLRRAA